MTNLVHKVAILILATVVFCAGTGVTIMEYCCSDCKPAYSILGQKHECYNSLEVSNKTEIEHISCPHCKAVTTDSADFLYKADIVGCTTSRVSVDLDFHHPKVHLSAPFVWLSTIDEQLFSLDKETIDSSDLLLLLEQPPPLIPRLYLSKIRVLII